MTASGPFFWSDWPEDLIRKYFGDADPMAYMAEMQRQRNNIECTDADRLRWVARTWVEAEQAAAARKQEPATP